MQLNIFFNLDYKIERFS